MTDVAPIRAPVEPARPVTPRDHTFHHEPIPTRRQIRTEGTDHR